MVTLLYFLLFLFKTDIIPKELFIRNDKSSTSTRLANAWFLLVDYWIVGRLEGWKVESRRSKVKGRKSKVESQRSKVKKTLKR